MNLLKERPEQQMIVIVEEDIGNATALEMGYCQLNNNCRDNYGGFCMKVGHQPKFALKECPSRPSNEGSVEKTHQEIFKLTIPTDDGVEVRRVFHKLRSIARENFNEHFKSIFDGHGQVPTKGLIATQRFALGAIFVYQLSLLYRFESGLGLCVGLKAFLKAA